MRSYFTTISVYVIIFSLSSCEKQVNDRKDHLEQAKENINSFQKDLSIQIPAGTRVSDVIAAFGKPNLIVKGDHNSEMYYYNWEGSELLKAGPGKIVGISILISQERVVSVSCSTAW